MDLKRIVSGQGNKSDHGKYLLAGILVYAVLLIITAILIIRPFTFITVCVSNLGNPNLNPEGYYIFTLAFVFIGIYLIPHGFYLYNHMFSVKRKINLLWLFLPIIASIGMIGVGSFNESVGPIHYVFATFAFGGMGLAMFSSLLIMGRNIRLKREWPSLQNFGILFTGILILSILALRELVIWGIDTPSELFLAEWYAFFLLFFWVIGMYFVIPAKKDDNNC